MEKLFREYRSIPSREDARASASVVAHFDHYHRVLLVECEATFDAPNGEPKDLLPKRETLERVVSESAAIRRVVELADGWYMAVGSTAQKLPPAPRDADCTGRDCFGAHSGLCAAGGTVSPSAANEAPLLDTSTVPDRDLDDHETEAELAAGRAQVAAQARAAIEEAAAPPPAPAVVAPASGPAQSAKASGVEKALLLGQLRTAGEKRNHDLYVQVARSANEAKNTGRLSASDFAEVREAALEVGKTFKSAKQAQGAA